MSKRKCIPRVWKGTMPPWRKRLEELKGVHGTWDALAQALAMPFHRMYRLATRGVSDPLIRDGVLYRMNRLRSRKKVEP